MYFLTWRCAKEQGLSPEERTIVLEAVRYWDNRKWKVYAAVVMSSHVHALVQPLIQSKGGSFDLAEILHSEPIAKVFFCGSTSSPRTEKFNDFNLSPFTLSRSKGKLRTFAITSSVKSFSAHQINRQRERHGSIWQDERFDRIVRDEMEFKEKWEYIRNNPVKNGLCQSPEKYPWLYERT